MRFEGRLDGVRVRCVAAVAGSLHNGGVAKPALDLGSLSIEEKLELIDELWESVDADDLPLTEELRRVLDDRLAAMDGDASIGIPWEQVRDDMRGRPR